MHNPKFLRTETSFTTQEIAKIALVAALYAAVTLLLAPFSFGQVQLRLSEMFNFLALFNKRYVWGVTLGCALANLTSPNGLIDVLVGSICTFFVLVICRFVTQNISDLRVKIAVTAVIFAVSMFTVAGQLTFLYKMPFFINWFYIGIGELLSMIFGGIVIYWLSQKIDFSK